MNKKNISRITSVIIFVAVLAQVASCSISDKTAESATATVTSANESVEASVSETEKDVSALKIVVNSEHSFVNGICKDCGLHWCEYYYDTLDELDKYSEGDQWRTIYGPQCDAMFDKGDYVQFVAIDKLTSIAYFRHSDEKFDGETCKVGVSDYEGETATYIQFEIELGDVPLGDGSHTSKFVYTLTIHVDPGEYDKVFKSRYSFACNCDLELMVFDGKSTFRDVWSSKTEDEIKKMLDDEGCTYYTKDQIIDIFWKDHARMLLSIDNGMSVMNTSLADAGINWKK